MADVSSNTNKPSFPQFGLASDYSDHHYADTKHDQIMNTTKKTIMREWRILEQNLPEAAIYVRVYDSRVDLLRAAIVGAHGTPYEHGLFFFDIKFPDNYPNQPPQVHYISNGLGLNPNLYPDGKVCLSLLNTWRGIKNSERWDPSRSTVLQVLVSIQGLVLNDMPLANEPLYGLWMTWFAMKSKSQIYNEHAFVSTCRSTLYLIQKPPRSFEAFVAEHFYGRASRILKACDEYTKLGYYNNDDDNNAASDSVRVESTEQLCPRLVNAYNQIHEQLIRSRATRENRYPFWRLLFGALCIGFSVYIVSR